MLSEQDAEREDAAVEGASAPVSAAVGAAISPARMRVAAAVALSAAAAKARLLADAEERDIRRIVAEVGILQRLGASTDLSTLGFW